MRKAIVPSVETAENIRTGTRTSERRRLPDQTGIGAIGGTRERYGLSRIWGRQSPPQVNKGRPRSFLCVGHQATPAAVRAGLNHSRNLGHFDGLYEWRHNVVLTPITTSALVTAGAFFVGSQISRCGGASVGACSCRSPELNSKEHRLRLRRGVRS